MEGDRNSIFPFTHLTHLKKDKTDKTLQPNLSNPELFWWEV
jgi:hypothetical protein